MTLDEAIKHAEEVAEQNEEDVIVYSNCKNHKKNLYEIGLAENAEKKCRKCAEEHRQLAEWLKELKDYRERILSYETGYNDAKREIALSGEYERAYDRGKSDAGQNKWIPVSERLPEDGIYLVTVERIAGKPRVEVMSFAKDLNRVDDYDFPEHKCGWYEYDSEYGYFEDTGVIAWMPLPQPYKGESEDKE